MALSYTDRFGLIQWGAGTDAYTRAEANAALATIEDLGAIDITVANAAALPAPGIQGRYIWQADALILWRDDGATLRKIRSLSTGVPAALSPSTAAAAGVSLDQTHADHIHDLPDWAISTDIDALTYGQASAAGAGTKFPRNDHGHAMPTHTKADHDALNIDADTLDGLSSADFDPAPPAGEVRMFAGAIPAGWLACDGSTLTRSAHPNLYAAIGITWGNGDNSGTTFSLPDLRGRVPVGAGHGPGLTNRVIGDTFGEETHVLTTAELANHNHAVTDPNHNHAGTTQAAHGHGVTDPGHIHGVTDPGHGHGLTDPTHVHGGGSHHHLPDNILGGDFPRVPGAGPHGLTQTNVTALVDLYSSTADTSIITDAAGAGESANGSSTGLSVDSHTAGVTANNATPVITVASDNTGITLASAGTGTAHNNVQPSGVLTFAIKT